MSSLGKIGTATALSEGSNISCLSEALSFRLARMVVINDRLGSKYFRDQKGLSLSEWRIMGLVAEGAPATTSSIRDRLLMDRGLLSRVVKALCERGLLTSTPNPDDKRHTLLALTPEGQKLHDNCIVFTSERNASMTSVLTAHEIAEFSRVLDLLIDHNTNRLTQEGLNDD